ncbi:hypothetical protein A11Q_1303 [Pseudobdellovibrio exovorus JSS]|uniref:Uncharacterized protein n=2 Tax=Pseudobdellovibrio exovorus TaxID=453816 RepID=M4VQU5_9BACT|nr:hypothetical protein A11Q_1303 [Pseudobdellovibrio exovorus JSS]
MGQFYFKAIKTTAIATACWTMVFSPVALGQQAERISREEVAQSIKELNLNRNTTLDHFWKNIKAYTPGYSYKNIDDFVKQNKNAKMPEVEFSTLRNTSGEQIPVIRFTQNGKTQTVQFFGEKNKWATFNGVVLTENDLQDIEKIYSKIEASDPKYRQEAQAYRARSLAAAQQPKNQFEKDMLRFQGFPRVTPSLWKSMTKNQRADYIVKMRMMRLSAKQVEAAFQRKSGSVAPKKNKESAVIENFYRAIFGQEAFAQTAAGAFSGQCVVAGYIDDADGYAPGVNYQGQRAQVCNIQNVLQNPRYREGGELSYVAEAATTCGALDVRANPSREVSSDRVYVPCNPVIYGYPGGNGSGDTASSAKGTPLCVNKNARAFQNVTTFPGICDQGSRLNTSSFDVTLSEDAAVRQTQLQTIESEQRAEDFRLTKEYLDGVLAHKGHGGLQQILDGEWNLAIDSEMVRIQSQFEAEINRAIGICRASLRDNAGRHETYQQQACEQLHRRWLFTERVIAQYRQKACHETTTYVGKYDSEESSLNNPKTEINKTQTDQAGTNLCKCEDGSLVNFGQACGGAIPTLPPVVVTPTCEDRYPGASGLTEDCKCSSGKDPQGPDSKGKYKCSSSSIVPIALAGLALFGIFAFAKKKKKKTPPTEPPVLCPDGSQAPNRNVELCPKPPQQCVLPQVGTYPNCACPNAQSCPTGSTHNPNTCGCDPNPPVSCPGIKVGTPPNCACPIEAVNACPKPYKLFDANTCTCTDVPQPPECPDGSKLALGQSLTLCPKCPDGTTYITTGQTCPVQNEGGSGNSCPAGQTCSGGLPPSGTGN